MSDSLAFGVFGLGAGLMALVVAAAYVRIAVVLAVLRSALGFGALPRSVTALLALVLALFVMMPVVERGARQLGSAGAGAPGSTGAPATGATAAPAMAAAPVGGDAKSDATLVALTEFLDQHTPEAERTTFVELARRIRTPDARAAVSGKSLDVLAPAFVIAELKAAFQIGFLLFLPFLVLELVVATLLSTLGMHSLDPRAVSLPFKLLLFVAADGWHLLARGLVLAYT